MRILGINGVLCYENPIWDNLKRSFARRFPGCEFSVEEDTGLPPWEVRRIRRFVEYLAQKYDDGDEYLLVGHSLGGVIACGVAARFRKSSVRGIVTVFAPHTFLWGVYPKVIGKCNEHQAPVLSFTGSNDTVVLWGTRHPKAVQHVLLRSNHFTDLVHDPSLAERVATDTKKFLFSDPGG